MPSTPKKTVAIPRDPESAFQRWTALSPGSTGGEILRKVAEGYLHIVNRSLPELQDEQWCVIFEALGPSWTASGSQQLKISQKISHLVESATQRAQS